VLLCVVAVDVLSIPFIAVLNPSGLKPLVIGPLREDAIRDEFRDSANVTDGGVPYLHLDLPSSVFG